MLWYQTAEPNVDDGGSIIRIQRQEEVDGGSEMDLG